MQVSDAVPTSRPVAGCSGCKELALGIPAGGKRAGAAKVLARVLPTALDFARAVVLRSAKAPPPRRPRIYCYCDQSGSRSIALATALLAECFAIRLGGPDQVGLPGCRRRSPFYTPIVECMHAWWESRRNEAPLMPQVICVAAKENSGEAMATLSGVEPAREI